MRYEFLFSRLYLCTVIISKTFKSRKLAFMKNLLLILTMAYTLNVSAGNIPTLKIVEDKTFVLNINDWKNSELNVSFFNQEGEEIYSEKITPSKVFQRKFNLQVLRKGDYQVIISSEFRSISYDVNVAEARISKISEGKVTYKSKGISRDIVSKIKSIH